MLAMAVIVEMKARALKQPSIPASRHPSIQAFRGPKGDEGSRMSGWAVRAIRAVWAECSRRRGRGREGGREGGRSWYLCKVRMVHAPTGSSKYRRSVKKVVKYSRSTSTREKKQVGEQVGREAGTERRWPAHVLTKYCTVSTTPGVTSKAIGEATKVGLSFLVSRRSSREETRGKTRTK